MSKHEKEQSTPPVDMMQNGEVALTFTEGAGLQQVPGGDRSRWRQDGDSETDTSGDQMINTGLSSPIKFVRQTSSKIQQISESRVEDAATLSGADAVDETDNVLEDVEAAIDVASCSIDRLSLSRSESWDEAREHEHLLCTKRIHIFVLSEAGKPIYTRHGSEEALCSLFGVMQTMVSSVCTNRARHKSSSSSGPPPATTTNPTPVGNDRLHSFQYRGWRCVFVHESPLILVGAFKSYINVVGSTHNLVSLSSARAQLYAVYAQILSILTQRQLQLTFEQKQNFDLRRLLSGTQKSLDNIVTLANTEPAVMLAGIRCLAMPVLVREAVHSAIVAAVNAGKIKNLVFAVVLARRQLVALVRLRKYTLAAGDFHVLVNLIECNPSFRNVETWTPVCLPRFDNTGYLHAHISYLSEQSEACLVLLTVERNAFHDLSTLRTRMIERLQKNKMLAQLNDACSSSVGAVRLSKIDIPSLWHFLYKNRFSSHVCASGFEPPFVSVEEQTQLMDRYRAMIDRVHNYADDVSQMEGTISAPATTASAPLRILFMPSHRFTVLSWVTSNFELYAAFNPLVSTPSAISKIDKLMKWLLKEQDRLFLPPSSPTLA